MTLGDRGLLDAQPLGAAARLARVADRGRRSVASRLQRAVARDGNRADREAMRGDPTPTAMAEAIKHSIRAGTRGVVSDYRIYRRAMGLRPRADRRSRSASGRATTDTMVPVRDAELLAERIPPLGARASGAARATSRCSGTIAPRSSAGSPPSRRRSRVRVDARRRDHPGTARPRCSQVAERPDPPVGPGEVRIAVRAAGINFADTMARPASIPTRRSRRRWSATRSPARSSRSGRGSRTTSRGDRVIAGTRFGGYAELVSVAASTRSCRCPTRSASSRARRSRSTTHRLRRARDHGRPRRRASGS